MANLVCKEYVSVSRLPKDKAADKVITFITSYSQHYVAKPLSTGSALPSLHSQSLVAFREDPTNWGIAEIRPIFMCGKEPNTTSSFRKISLLSIAELVERFIHEHLESNHLLHHPASAGFPRNRSTEEQVAAVTQFIHDGIQQRRPHLRTDLLLPDFSRGYDRVWIKALLA